MFEMKGILVFDPMDVTKKHGSQSAWKKVAIVKFDCELPEYYSWFLKKRFNLFLNKPLRGTHLTFINEMVDDDVYLRAKEIFDGTEASVSYDPSIVRSNKRGHWWLKSESPDCDSIRSSMGLGEPYFGLHMTIGLATHLQLEHSKYITDECIRVFE